MSFFVSIIVKLPEFNHDNNLLICDSYISIILNRSQIIVVYNCRNRT